MTGDAELVTGDSGWHNSTPGISLCLFSPGRRPEGHLAETQGREVMNRTDEVTKRAVDGCQNMSANLKEVLSYLLKEGPTE